MPTRYTASAVGGLNQANYIIHNKSGVYELYNGYTGALVNSGTFAAMLTLATAADGFVSLREGTFNLLANVRVTKNIRLQGAGRNLTKIVVPDATSLDNDMIIHGSDVATETLMHISDLTLDGNYGGVGILTGRHLISAYSSLIAERVKFIESGGTGLVARPGTVDAAYPLTELIVDSCEFYRCGNPNTHVGPGIRTAPNGGSTNLYIPKVTIVNNLFREMYEHAIKLYAHSTTQAMIDNNMVLQCDGSGISAEDCSTIITNNKIYNAAYVNASASGILVGDAGVHKIAHNVIGPVVTTGIGIRANAGIESLTIDDNDIYGVQRAIYSYIPDGIITKNRIHTIDYDAIYLNAAHRTVLRDNNLIHTGGAGYYDININNANNCIMQGNRFRGARAICNTGTSAGHIIEGNFWDGATTFITNPTVTDIIRNNKGFVTEALGTGVIASGSTSVTITHGLGYTPTIGEITITPSAKSTTDPTFYIWVSGITTTQFVVNCSTAPGVLTLPFGWSVRRIL